MPVIERLRAREILDSRGRPTVWASCKLSGREPCSTSVPSGASTGRAEAHELRDGDARRYRGLGCRKAVANINDELNGLLSRRSFESQSDLDHALIDIDSTPNKSRLGANALLAVSLSFARSMAASSGIPLWKYFAGLVHADPRTFPRLTINLFSGGRHAGSQVAIQDVLLVPSSAQSIDESLAMTYDVYHSAADLVKQRYGMRLLRADEGGLAPPFRTSEEMIEAAMHAIQKAGYLPGKDFRLAIDVAASEFYCSNRYNLDGEELDPPAMIERLVCWIDRYPIVSVEDGLSQEDWQHWPHLKRAIAARSLIVGDDLLCTNVGRIRRAIDTGAANALLLKLNQVGTLTEAADAYRMARSARWAVSISVRSGETEDDWAADLAVGWQGDQFKNGSITQSERLAKYNRLLAIEQETKWPFINWPETGSSER
ncbi:MAG: phosphopyruvate hydratase [Acidobacteriaceae bacterium]|nr:phosphopyruvate hydratase [Acidobacteriaceae bacterium]